MPEELLDSGNALGWLRAEHEQIRALLTTCLTSDQSEFTRQVLVPLMQEFELHTTLEREIFYPLAKRHMSFELLDRGTHDNRDLDQAAARLKRLDPAHPSFRKTLEEFSHLFQHHVYELEQNVFLQLEGGDWELHQQLIEAAFKLRNRREQLVQRLRNPRTGASSMANEQMPDASQINPGSEEGTRGQQ